MRIAVTGMGARVPGAVGLDALWERMLRPDEPQPGPYAHRDWRGFWLPPDSDCAELALEVCRQAWPAGSGVPPWLVLGTCSAMMRGTERAWAPAEAGEPVDPATVLWPQLPHQPTDRVREGLGLATPGWTVSTACTSGAVALGRAASLVASGLAPRALAVGVDVISPLTWYGFGSLGLQARGRCLPFDRGRNGLNLGEGAAALLLERPEDAHARGATIYGYVTGYGNATDAYHMSTPEPAGAGAERAIRQALASGAPVGWVNAHGTGTINNDAIEARMLARVLPGLPVTANKGALGHTLGAAGTLEAVVTLLGLLRGEIPPSVPLPDPEPGLDLVQQPRPLPCRAALSVNLAFGGSNTALRLEAP